ncbi:protein kinase [Gleimia sp. 6138-11-ORH1]|uniref:protein kinase domain-containing protein n=1 Tax=Gleimia sp. 6138-11-ORH1 TaxID=2973937 RepID=UPI00216720D0|nr:protein kinase [Gleimia sp. 6138-11-ORH1]MCS4484264.1 protein kinase [Gleimia sp. 6138-11-ORH1]
MNFADYQVIRPLAQTTHGPLLLVTNPNGLLQVMRFISRGEYADNAARISKLSEISFEHCANLQEIFMEENRVAIITDYVQGQSLAELMLIPGAIKPKFATFIVKRIAEALSELHSWDLFHGDLTPSNIVITAQGKVKLIDFATVVGGTAGYTMPGSKPSASADLFALEQICKELGVPAPASTKAEKDPSLSEEENGFALEDAVNLSPAALWRAELARPVTLAVSPTKSSRGRHAQVKSFSQRFSFGAFSRRVLLGISLLLIGVVSFTYWVAGNATENQAVKEFSPTQVGSVAQQNLNLQTSDQATGREQVEQVTCMQISDAESIIRSLLKQRNTALMELDVQKLESVYVPESSAYLEDQALFSRLKERGMVVNGVRSEIRNLQVVDCADLVRVQFEHRLLEYELCTRDKCVMETAGKPRVEELYLQGPRWRIVKIAVLFE